ncbi:hypothetical protein AAHH62_05500 [Enterococcus faecium]
MEVEQIKYQGMDRERLIDIIEQQRLELIQKEAVCKEYKKHLEQVIEDHSVEKYRSVVQKIEKQTILLLMVINLCGN